MQSLKWFLKTEALCLFDAVVNRVDDALSYRGRLRYLPGLRTLRGMVEEARLRKKFGYPRRHYPNEVVRPHVEERPIRLTDQRDLALMYPSKDHILTRAPLVRKAKEKACA